MNQVPLSEEPPTTKQEKIKSVHSDGGSTLGDDRKKQNPSKQEHIYSISID
jgi:hypothetical protein